METVYLFDVSLYDPTPLVLEAAGQCDTGRHWAVRFLDRNGQVFVIPPEAGVELHIKKPDNKISVIAGEVRENRANFVLSAQALAVAGRAEATVLIKHAATELRSQQVIFPIPPDAVSSDTLQSLNEWQDLNEAVSAAQQIKSDVETIKADVLQAQQIANNDRLGAETARSVAEACQREACTCAQQAQEAAAAAGSAKTAAQQSADAASGHASTASAAAENASATAAQIVTDENQRQQSEAERVQAEQERKSTETARKGSETKRVNAENQRLQNEQTRAANEEQRKTAEQSRATQSAADHQTATQDHAQITSALELIQQLESGQLVVEVTDLKQALQVLTGRLNTLMDGDLDENLDQIKELSDAIKAGGASLEALTQQLTTKATKDELTTARQALEALITPKADQSWVAGQLAGKVGSSQHATDLNGKVDKVSGKGLSTCDYTTADRAKVQAIPDNPQYTDTTYTAATQAKEGLMSAADKKKLDDLAADVAGAIALFE